MGRTIWVGDVHGCREELEELLSRVGLGDDDQLVFVGDLVARGPDTPGVVRLARESKALSVRGNHEHRILLAHEAVLAKERGPRLGPSHQTVLRELTAPDWNYLEQLPLSLEFPDHNVRVVHAGVDPRVPFEEQQAWTLLHVRSLTSQGTPSDRYSSASWAESYGESPHVVFGHNAQAGLQLHPFATGLDTACVYGNSLSALVLEHGQEPPPVADRKDAIVSVPARERHVGHGPRSD